MARVIKYSITNISLESLDVGFNQKAKKVAELFVVYILAALVLSVPLQLTDRLIVKPFYDFSFYQQMEGSALKIANRFGDFGLFYVVLLGPFLEEMLFRLPLSLEKIGIGVSFALITYRLSVGPFLIGIEYNNPYWYVKLAVALCVYFLTIKLFPSSWLRTIKENYFPHVFYFISFAFAIVHITNFAPYNSHVIFFYPVFILPQFLMGIFIGYARMQCGFLYGVALHGLINLLFVLTHLHSFKIG